MQLLELTLDSPEENLALDEALWGAVENGTAAGQWLRLWESTAPFVVLGRSSSYQTEVHQENCRRLDIPVLRRTSGGGTVLAGPGCLMFAVVLDLQIQPQLRQVTEAHQSVLARICSAVQSAGAECSIEGICDLAHRGQKVGGNALRCGRRALLYHGTLLYSMSQDLIAECLARPLRQPAWRQERSHAEFVRTLPVEREALIEGLTRVWAATPANLPACHELIAATRHLAHSRYSVPSWTELGQTPAEV